MHKSSSQDTVDDQTARSIETEHVFFWTYFKLSRYKSLKSVALFFIKFSIILNERAWTIFSKDGGSIQEVETKKLSGNDYSYPFPLVSVWPWAKNWILVASVFLSVKSEKSYKYCKVVIESFMWIVLYVTIQYSTRVCKLWRFDYSYDY